MDHEVGVILFLALGIPAIAAVAWLGWRLLRRGVKKDG